jgi:hypothetical protein
MSRVRICQGSSVLWDLELRRLASYVDLMGSGVHYHGKGPVDKPVPSTVIDTTMESIDAKHDPLLFNFIFLNQLVQVITIISLS